MRSGISFKPTLCEKNKTNKQISAVLEIFQHIIKIVFLICIETIVNVADHFEPETMKNNNALFKQHEFGMKLVYDIVFNYCSQ